jgi:holliday junction DNA helicase RuvA
MIGSLQGRVELLDSASILLDVQGVGYKVLVPSSVMSKLTGVESAKLYIYSHVRDDEFTLFGFNEKEDLKLFEYLISVSGVGPKTALGIFSVGERSEIISAILSADTSFFTGVPRLGTKNAQKIIIELKGKLGEGTELDLAAQGGDNAEIFSALSQFGFTDREVREALKSMKKDGLTTEEKIKQALKYLGK